MNQCMIERFSICFKLSSFYVLHIKTVRFPYRERTVFNWSVLHIKTVRFPYRERTVFNWRTYGFDMETIKG